MDSEQDVMEITKAGKIMVVSPFTTLEKIHHLRHKYACQYAFNYMPGLKLMQKLVINYIQG